MTTAIACDDARAAVRRVEDELHMLRSELSRRQRRNSERLAELQQRLVVTTTAAATTVTADNNDTQPYVMAARQRACVYRVLAATAHAKQQLARLWQTHVIDGWYVCEVQQRFVRRVHAQLQQLHTRLQHATRRLRRCCCVLSTQTSVTAVCALRSNSDDDDMSTLPLSSPSTTAHVFLQHYVQQLQARGNGEQDDGEDECTAATAAAAASATTSDTAVAAHRPRRTLAHVVALLLRVLPEATAAARSAQRLSAVLHMAATAALCAALQATAT